MRNPSKYAEDVLADLIILEELDLKRKKYETKDCQEKYRQT